MTAAYDKRHHHGREDDHVSDGDHWERLSDFFGFTHFYFSKPQVLSVGMSRPTCYRVGRSLLPALRDALLKDSGIDRRFQSSGSKSDNNRRRESVSDVTTEHPAVRSGIATRPASSTWLSTNITWRTPNRNSAPVGPDLGHSRSLRATRLFKELEDYFFVLDHFRVTTNSRTFLTTGART